MWNPIRRQVDELRSGAAMGRALVDQMTSRALEAFWRIVVVAGVIGFAVGTIVGGIATWLMTT
jgi:hypothetical protein